MRRRGVWLAGVAMAVPLAAVSLSDVELEGNTGPSTLVAPLVIPSAAGVRTISILTTGDTVGPKLDGITPYRMLGIPDGMGAFDNGDGTFTMLSNHEFGSTSGTVRAHGSAGATVSAWVVDRKTLAVRSGGDLIRNVMLWDAATQSWLSGTTAFQRFCSADLAEPTAFFDPATGKGTHARLFMNGEETGGGRAMVHIATGPNAGVSYEFARMGRDAWENVVACPFPQEKTVVVGTDDSTPGQVYVYVGTKTSSGNEVQRAGLANGKVYGVIANAIRTEDRDAGIVAKGASAPFTLADLGDASAVGHVTETTADNAGVTEFLRPEDGAWDPNNPTDFYFVTTDRFDQTKNATGTQVGRSRLWRLRFTNLAQPELGGQISVLLDGTEAHNMLDNMCVTRSGHVYMQEDTGGVSWTARLWRYTIATGAVTEVARHDPAKFGSETAPAVAPYSQDEESSGILDASSILGPGWLLFDVQAHGGTSPGTEIVENGQFLAMYDPAGALPPEFLLEPASSADVVPAGRSVTFRAEAESSAGGAVTYLWDFGDGSSATTSEATHAYVTPGTYQASCTATHTASGLTAEKTVEVKVVRPMGAPTLNVTLDFARANRDAVTLRAALPIEADFTAAGKTVTVEVGGLSRTFTLDAKGRGSSDGATFALAVRRVRGKVLAQRAIFTFAMRKASVQEDFEDEGLTNDTVDGEPVVVPIEVVFDGTSYDSVADLIYTSKEGKRGVAK